MKKLLLFLWIGALLFGSAAARAADPEPATEYEIITLNGKDEPGIEWDVDQKVGTATNGVMVIHHDERRGLTTLSATRMRVNTETGQAHAEGNVVMQREGQVWKGEKLDYNFHTKQ